MTSIPGFNPKTMTDDELLHKTEQLSTKLAYASSSISGGGTNYLQMMLQALEAERQERLYLTVWKMQERQLNKVIDTDGDPSSGTSTAASGEKAGKQPAKALPWKKTARPVASPSTDARADEPADKPAPEGNKP